ncbi:FkbM family methyltransferase [Falsiroseomonas sp.]|uniref:FkbM family methyltransferase n=1 Tax=Falsiroseomonas sp. TaxID=2870721 RepID=UPI0034A2A9E9
MLRDIVRFEVGAALPTKAALNIQDAAVQDYLQRLYEGGKTYHAWLTVWRHFAKWEGTFLDIGANMGQSITSFGLFNPRMRIWSFEPNPLCAESIAFAAGLVPNEVNVFMCGISDEDAGLTLHVPVLRGSNSFGPSSNASLRRTELEKGYVVQRLLGTETDRTALSFVEVPAQVRRLSSIGEPEALRIVKIDVEGFERRVLDGITPAIRRHRPVLTVERNNWPEVLEWMQRENYGGFDHEFDGTVGTLRPDPPGRGGKVVDAVLLPLERVDEIMASAEGLRLAG